jgi:dTDP-4-amino-4,6-dideoxygalactose transaminase
MIPNKSENNQELSSITMSAPDLTDAEVEAVTQVLSTPSLSIGPKIKSFEKSFAQFVGTAHGVGVNSGTSGLHLSVIAAGLGEFDLAITSPFSFIASANCILYERAIPVFVDVDPLTACIDPKLVAECARDLSDDPAKIKKWMPSGSTTGSKRLGRLKVILPVHAFGRSADMDPIMSAARARNLAVIEDACEAIGSEYRGRKVGSIGDAAVFAFYPNKQMTTGEGGMIVTENQGWDALFRSLRNQGRDVFDGWLNHTRLGYNYRLDEMSAALGIAQMQRIGELLTKRERVAAWYTERLAGKELIETPNVPASTTHMSWFVYVVQIKPPARRDDVIKELARSGIPSRPYFTPIHLQPFYVQKFGYRKGDFPVTEDLGEKSLALPFSGVMTEAQVAYVCKQLDTATKISS